MSHERFGAAVVVAGLLTASPIALGKVEEENTRERKSPATADGTISARL